VVAIHEHIARQVGQCEGEERQDENLGIPEDMPAIPQPAERLGPHTDAIVVLRRGNDELEQVEPDGELGLVVPLDLDVAVVPQRLPGSHLLRAQRVVVPPGQLRQGALDHVRRLFDRVAAGGVAHQLVDLQRLGDVQFLRHYQARLARTLPVLDRALARCAHHGSRRQVDVAVARLAQEPEPALAVLSLREMVPVQQIFVADVPIDPRLDGHMAGPVHRRQHHAHRADVFARVAGEALEGHVQHGAIRRLPAYLAAQKAVTQVQPAAEMQAGALIQAEKLPVDGDHQIEPVGQVGQFGEDDRPVVEDAVRQGEGMVARIALFQAAARAEIAVAGGEDGLQVMLASRLQPVLAHRPGRVAAGGDVQIGQSQPSQAVAARHRPEMGLDLGEARGRPQSQAGHPRIERRFDAGRRILDHQALAGTQAHAGSGITEKVGRGFLAGHAVPVGQGRQAVSDAQPLDDGGGVAAGGGDGIANVRLIEQIKEIGDSWQQVRWRDPLQHLLIVTILARHHLFQVRFVHRATLQQPQQRLAPRHAAQVLVVGAGEGHALFVGQTLPCLVVIFSGVGDHTVQIENERFDRVGHDERYLGRYPRLESRITNSGGNSTCDSLSPGFSPANRRTNNSTTRCPISHTGWRRVVRLGNR